MDPPLTMVAVAAVADHARLVCALGERCGCDPMVAWAIAHARPACLDPDAPRRGRRPKCAVCRTRLPGCRALACGHFAHAGCVPDAARACSACLRSGGGRPDPIANCPACDEPMALQRHEGGVTFAPCGHTMHTACGAAMAVSYAAQGKALPYACPMEGCAGVLSWTSMHVLPAAAAELHNPAHLTRAFAPCPRQCGRYVRSFRAGPHAVTCACGQRFCHACRRPGHLGACAAVVAAHLGIERATAALAALDRGMPLLAEQMADQYRVMLGANGAAEWAILEVSSFPDLLLPIALPDAKPAGADVPDAELVARARAAYSPPWTTWARAAPPPPTVLDEVFAGLGTEAAGAETQGDGGGDGGGKFCPHCFMRVVRISGCPSMKCTMRGCGKTFCYECLGAVHSHGECSRAPDLVALRASAARAHVRVDEVDATLAAEERTVMADILARGEEGLRAFERKAHGIRLSRLLPMVTLAERLDALTAFPDVPALEPARASLRASLRLAVAAEEAWEERARAHPVGHRPLAAARQHRTGLAAHPTIRHFAVIRMTLAKARVHRILGAPTENALNRAADIRAALRALDTMNLDDWMRGPPNEPGVSVEADGSTFPLARADPPMLVLMHGRTVPVNLRECRQPPRLNHFGTEAVLRARDAVRAVIARVRVAAEDIAESFVPAAALAPVATPHELPDLALKTGDLVVRGREWRWGVQDGGDGRRGVVMDMSSDGDIVTVLWWSNGHRNTYTPDGLRPARPWAAVHAVLRRELRGRAKRDLMRLHALFGDDGQAILEDARLRRALLAMQATWSAAVPPPSTWECPACTLINPVGLSRCDVCEAARPILAPPSAVLPGSIAERDAALARVARALS